MVLKKVHSVKIKSWQPSTSPAICLKYLKKYIRKGDQGKILLKQKSETNFINISSQRFLHYPQYQHTTHKSQQYPQDGFFKRISIVFLASDTIACLESE